MMSVGQLDHGSLSLFCSSVPPLLSSTSPSSSSSCSSTLSPLAPPFTVDRSVPTASSHGFQDPFEDWLHLHPPTSSSSSPPSTFPAVGFISSQPTHLPSLGSTSHFVFGLPPEVPTSSIVLPEPYYPRHVTPISDKNPSISNQFSYGVSNSGDFPLGVSSESDYPQYLAPVHDKSDTISKGFSYGASNSGEYQPYQPAVHDDASGLKDLAYGASNSGDSVFRGSFESGYHQYPAPGRDRNDSIFKEFTRGVSTTGAFQQYPMAIHDANALVSKDLAYGVSNSGDLAAGCSYESDYVENSDGFGHTANQTGLWLGMGRLVMPNYNNPSPLGGPVLHGKSVDSLSKKADISLKGTGLEWQNASSTSISQESASPSLNMLRPSVFTSSSMLQEASYSQIFDPEPLAKTWNPFSFQTTNPRTSYPSAPVPSANISSSPLETTSKYVSSMNQTTDAWINKQDCVNGTGNEGNASTNKTSVETKKNHHKFSVDPSIKMGFPLSMKSSLSLRSPSKGKPELEFPPLHFSKGFTFAPGTSGPDDSLGSYPGVMDQFVPAIDSPCWKGAPSSQRSPFGVVEAPFHLSPMKEREECSKINLKNPLLSDNFDDAEGVSSLELSENSIYLETGSVKRSSESSFSLEPTSVVTISCIEQIAGANKIESDCFMVSNGKGIQSSVGMQESRSKDSFELGTSDAKCWSHDEGVTCVTIPVPKSRIADLGTDPDGTAQNVVSKVSSQPSEHVPNGFSSGISFPSHIDDKLGPSDVSSDCSLPRLDTQVLVKMIHNLSELLLSSHFNDGNALKERDYEVLQLAIGNLDACVSNKVGIIRPKLASFPGWAGSNCLKRPTVPHEGTITGGSPVTAKDTDVLCQSDHQDIHEEEAKIHTCKFSKRVDKFHSCYSSNHTDSEKENGMNEAIEKVMKENIGQQEDEYHQALLYKNLWIEAEAALCSMKYELQLTRMKIELEKHKKHQDAGPDTIFHGSPNAGVGRPSDLDAFLGMDVDSSLSPKRNVSSDEDDISLREDAANSSCRTFLEVNLSGLNDEANDMESSVIARFRVLQSQIGNLSSQVQKSSDSSSVSDNDQGDCKVAMPNEDVNLSEDAINSSYRNPKEVSKSSSINEAKELEPSVLARLRVLQGRVEKHLPHITGTIADRHSPIPSLRCLETQSDVGMENTTTKAVNSWSADMRCSHSDGSTEVEKKYGMEHLGVNFTDGIGFQTDGLEQFEVRSVSNISIVDETAFKVHEPPQAANLLLPGSHDSPSSDWEHVLKEELTWEF